VTSTQRPLRAKPVQAADAAAGERARASEGAARAWWHRVPRVVTAPRDVFRALREDDEDDVAARGEPILAIVLLAGIAGAILTPTWGRLLDNKEVDGVVAAILTFIGGGAGGAVTYFVLGFALLLGIRGAGSLEPMRLARQIAGFAALPVALSLIVTLPVALVAFGGDFFRTGGSDEGVGRWIVVGLGLGFVAWSLALLVLGLRTTLRLPWRGVVTAVAVSGVATATLVFLPYLF
jgi:hypothetical protein